jgi:serine/threonine-protein kinase
MAERDPWLLRRNHVVDVEANPFRYRVHETLGRGGFGRAYRATREDGRGRVVDDVCLKVMDDRQAWVTEAYFATLVEDEPRAVQVRDFFPFSVGSGSRQRLLYALVSDYMSHGTVEDWVAREPTAWPESRLRAELAAVLKLLSKLHATGATHRDLTPANMFIGERNRLMVGDFGIAQHLLTSRRWDRHLGFNEDFVPDSLYARRRGAWQPSDDLYELGVVALILATGCPFTGALDRRRLRSLPVSDELRAFLLRLIAKAGKDRFADASQALLALKPETTPWAPTPGSLRGHKVVFTGPLEIKRQEAEQWVRQVGASVQGDVNGATTIVVMGRAHPLYRHSPRAGTKLHDALMRAKAGQAIAVIDEGDLRRLTTLGK